MTSPDLMLELIKHFMAQSIWFKLFAMVVGSIYFVITSLRFVPEASLGVKLRFGRVVRDWHGKPKIYKPGFVLLIPHIENLAKHMVRQQTIMLPDQVVTLKDDTGWDTNAYIKFRIVDLYKAMFEIDGLELAIRNAAMSKIRSVLQTLENYHEIKDVEGLSKRLMQEMKLEQEQWGIEISDFHLVNCAPTAATANIITITARTKTSIDAVKKLKESGITDPSVIAALMGVPAVTTIASATNPGSIEVPIKRQLDGFHGDISGIA